MMKDERLVSKREVKLIFRGASRLSGTGIVEWLEIIDVGCNLKQFDAKADRNAFFHVWSNENADENEIPFSAENKTGENYQIAHFRCRKRKRISVGF